MPTNNTLNPCPFCGSTELTTNYWSMNDGEQEAIECTQCYGSNLRKNWNNRKTLPLKIPCLAEVPLFSLCAGVVTKTAENSVQITDNTNHKYNYGNIDHRLKIDQIIEAEQIIGFCKKGSNHIELQVAH